jgi:sec-independent protein translocase protein TatC
MTAEIRVNTDEQEGGLPFLAHIEELRQRLIKVVLSIIIFAIAAYYFSDILVDYFIKPIGTVYFRQPTGAFLVRLKIAGFAGLVLAIPVLLYQFWMFVIPGLYRREIRYLVPVTVLGTLFFLGGGAFCFFLVIPRAMEFLKSFATPNLLPLIDVSEYFSFVFWMCVAFGAVFQLPIVAFFLGRIGLITSHTLGRGRRLAVVIILVVAALITPTPDAFSMMLLAAPLYILYEVSILVVRFTGVRREE